MRNFKIWCETNETRDLVLAKMDKDGIEWVGGKEKPSEWKYGLFNAPMGLCVTHYGTLFQKRNKDEFNYEKNAEITVSEYLTSDKTNKNEPIVIYKDGTEIIGLKGTKAIVMKSTDNFEADVKSAVDKLFETVTFRVLCVKDCSGVCNTLLFKKGKAYSFINGRSVKEDGSSTLTYKDFDDFMTSNESFKDCFIELKDGDDAEAIMKEYDSFVHEFKRGKTYVFRKNIFIKATGCCCGLDENWINKCNGKIVTASCKKDGFINGYGIAPEWCEELDFAIGDKVEVVYNGKACSYYSYWEGLKGYEQNFVNNKLPENGKTYKLLNLEKHGAGCGSDTYALIQNPDTTQVFIISVKGIKRA